MEESYLAISVEWSESKGKRRASISDYRTWKVKRKRRKWDTYIIYRANSDVIRAWNSLFWVGSELFSEASDRNDKGKRIALAGSALKTSELFAFLFN